MNDVIWERRDCVGAPVEDSLVLLDLDTLVYHSLNRTAADVWELLAEPKGVDSLVSSLCSRYAIAPGACRASVDRLLGELAAKGLVKPHEPQQATAA